MFEILPNEIILEIFSYLELSQVYHAFSSLNIRFQQLLFYDDYRPLYVRLPEKFTLPLEHFLFRLCYITVINWNSEDLNSILQPTILPRLNRLTIESSTNLYFGKPTNDIFHRIVSIPTLYKCTIDIPTTFYINDFRLLTSTSIRHLKLNMITLDMLFFILINLPELYSLDIWLNSNGRRFDSQTYNQHYCCLKLRKLIIGLHSDITFDEVLFLLHRMPILQSLEIFGSVWHRDFLMHNHWENILLGENLFPLLYRIKVKIAVRRSTNTPRRHILITQFNRPIFHQTQFSLTYDQLWFYLKCLWNR